MVDALNVPAVQLVHVVDELLVENVPALHAVHRVAPLLTVYVPAEHVVHTDRPLVSVNLPLAHSWQMGYSGGRSVERPRCTVRADRRATVGREFSAPQTVHREAPLDTVYVRGTRCTHRPTAFVGELAVGAQLTDGHAGAQSVECSGRAVRARRG